MKKLVSGPSVTHEGATVTLYSLSFCGGVKTEHTGGEEEGVGRKTQEHEAPFVSCAHHHDIWAVTDNTCGASLLLWLTYTLIQKEISCIRV